jgi:molybdate transport system ATP-binding protein
MSLEFQVRRRLGAFVVDAALNCGPGVTALFGRSGSGKTSIVNMVAGLLKPDAGRILADGRVFFDSAAGIDLPPHKRRVGYVFQDARLFPHLSVRQNLLYGSWFAPKGEKKADLAHIVGLLDIGRLLHRLPRTLSGGERQRVAIGRALLANPRVLLMDEPLASLDAARKAEILPYLSRLKAEARLPILFVSHQLEEVAALADRMAVVAEGRIAATGSVAEITARLDIRSLTERAEAGAILDCVVKGHDRPHGLTVLSLGAAELRVPFTAAAEGERVRVRIRSRDVAIATEAPHNLSVLNVLSATVSEIAADGPPYVEVRLQVNGSAILARVTSLAVERLGLAPGRAVYALIKSVAFEGASGRERLRATAP